MSPPSTEQAVQAERACFKVKYPTKGHAQRTRRFMTRRGAGGLAGTEVYWHPDCKAWHLGHGRRMRITRSRTLR